MSLDRSMLSVVMPTYNEEEETLLELDRRLNHVIPELGFDRTEVVLVDDGSGERSRRVVHDLVEGSRLYKVVLLTRNFGHQAAVSTGLEVAQGSVVAIMDSDLQDPPEVLAALIDQLERGADVAYGVRRARKESAAKRAAYFLFYRLLNRISTIDIPLDAGDFCCMRRRVVDKILELPERRRFLRGLRAWVGFNQAGVPYDRAARFAGPPKYTMWKLLGLTYDGIFSFSNLPVRLMQVLGFVVSVVSFVTALIYFLWYFISPQRFPSGFATLVISLWFLAGVQLLFLGVVGEYVYRTCEESRGRPTALVAAVVTQGQAGQAESEVCKKTTVGSIESSTTSIGGGGAAKP